MKKQRKFFIKQLIGILLISFVLTGCLSLAEDITPPPNARPQNKEETILPTAQSTQDVPPTAESQTENLAGTGLVNVFVLDQTGGVFFEDDPVVILEGYDQFQLAFESSLPVSDDGFVQFSEIPFTEGRVYFASIPYSGAVYRSQIVVVEGEPDNLELQVEIFETTTDQSGLVIDRLHVLLEFNQPNFVDVVEIYIFSNFGDTTIVPASAGEISVQFPLPAEALGISFEDGSLGQRYLKTEDGFGDTVSIPPGSGIYPVSVYYSLPYENSTIDFVQRLYYPVGAVVVMMPAGEVIVQGAGLEDLGVQSIPSGEVQVFSASNFAADEILEFRVSGEPAVDQPETASVNEPAAVPVNIKDVVIYGAGALGAILLIGGVWLLIRNRQQDSSDLDVNISDNSREDIMDSIIALDDLFENGEITEKAYRQKRQQLKEKLSNILRITTK